MVRVLTSGYIGFSNFGDDAIFKALVQYLKSTGHHIGALSSNPQLTEELFDVEAYKYMNPYRIIKALNGCDIFISGGGSLLQNKTSNKSLIYYLALILLAKIMDKKIIIFAQGIGPIKGNVFQAITKYTLSLADVVTVRNSFSQRLLNRWGIKSKLVCDPVWNINTPKYEPKNIIGVQLRSYNAMHPNFIKDLAEHINLNYQDKKIQIFPFQKSLDDNICSYFYALLKQKNSSMNVEIVPYVSIEKTKDDFSHLETLFAMRFHACLLGLKMGIKTLPMSYDEKVVNLASDFEIEYIEVDKKVNFPKTIEKSKLLEQMNKTRFDWEYFTQTFGARSEGVDI